MICLLSPEPPHASAEAKVAVLLCVYNGGRFLLPQLDSLRAQTVGRIDVWASDDGSSDGSASILLSAREHWQKGDFHILEGPHNGFSENFRSLIVNDDIDADYVAFCDQDDLWDEDKLEAAVHWLETQPDDRPALYCSRTRLIDEDDRPIGYSPFFPRPPSFRNALVQSIAGANTMVLNRAAHRLVREASRRTGFVSHDWWCYLLVTGAGGTVHYSAEPGIGYRQHGTNLVGSNDSSLARLKRYAFLWQGGFAGWMERNLAGLEACRDLLDDNGRDLLDSFARVRRAGLLRRLAGLRKLGLYRQTPGGHIGIFIASALGRL